MNSPGDDRREEHLAEVRARARSEAEQRERECAAVTPDPKMPTWLKLILIVVFGIPLGLLVLGGLVLGVCLLAVR